MNKLFYSILFLIPVVFFPAISTAQKLFTDTLTYQEADKKIDSLLSAYPATIKHFSLKSSQLIFKDGTKRFITITKESLTDTPNFAGECVVVEWGCGISCQCSAIINLDNGWVTWGTCAATGFIYSPDSRLFVVDPIDKDTPDYISPETDIYLWVNNKLKLFGKIYHTGK